METEQTGEQPELKDDFTHAPEAEPEIEVENVDTGSFLNKFKSTEELLKAYENLEKEFTRKSQALAELNKQKQINKGDGQTKHVYEADDWAARVADFKVKHPEAEQYSARIAERILKSDAIKNSSEPLLAAYTEVITSELKSRDALATDPEFINNILKQPEVRDSVIADYIASISMGQELPKVISTKLGASLGNEKRSAPKNLAEARELAEKLING